MPSKPPTVGIFISYARQDRRIAERLSAILEEHGFSVWWDREIVPGTIFDVAISRKLDDARCVLVLWSSRSVDSGWVQKEAKRALKGYKLLPVLLEDIIPPSALRRVHAASLVGWTGSTRASAVQDLVILLKKRLHPPVGHYYAPMDEVSRDGVAGLLCSGKHLANCLKKADPLRRKEFLARYGIVESETGGYLICLGQRYDYRTRRNRTEWIKSPHP